MNTFYTSKRILFAEVKVKLEIHGNTDFLKRIAIAKRLCSVYVVPLLADTVQVELVYPNYKSASRACKNFAKNKQISSIDLTMHRAYK
jgi:hypothetical protein